jgi:sensor histidine kinase regulating citrate/malate metabolism
MKQFGDPGVLLDQARDKIVLLDESRKFGSVNEAARHILGLAPDDLVGENAIRHSDADHPTVRVRLRRTAYHAEFVVKDDATPIPPADARVLHGDHEMSQVYHSSALGFWLVYWAVEFSDGGIAIHSESDRGNRVTVTLPREPGDRDDEP